MIIKEPTKSLTLKEWNVSDRPREKLLQKGVTALSDAELLAILIGSGTVKTSAVTVAQAILASVNYNLSELGRLDNKQLRKFKGIGSVKAVTILASMELGRRRREALPETKTCITTSNDAYQLLKGDLSDLNHEEFWILILNRANRVLEKVPISKGGISGTVADPRIIIRKAADSMASSIILAHNHPSGNLKPSESDKSLTQKIKEGARYFDIEVLDHLIITGAAFFSFADEGLL